MKLIIGCGKMGGAILEGWLQNGIQDVIVMARNKERALQIQTKYQVQTILSLDELSENPEIILCAIKPYQMDEVLPAYKKLRGSIFISVVVGKSIKYIKNLIGEQHFIIRAMPNITCLIKQGVIGTYGEKKLSVAHDLLSTVGKVFPLKNENEIEITAALPGALPAFLMKIIDLYSQEIATANNSQKSRIKDEIIKSFRDKEKLLMIDHILNGWISDATLLGLNNNMAIEMSLRSVVGTAELLKTMSPDDIITAIASKKGTTEAGLLAIEHGISPIIGAYRRALEINSN